MKKKIILLGVVLVLCCIMCGCVKENLFSEKNTQKLSMGNISFRIPNSAVDDFNPDWLIQQFEIDGVGDISVAQVNKYSDSEYYQSFEEVYEIYRTIDNSKLITSLNGKTLDKGYKSITVSDDETAGHMCAFVDDNCYCVALTADSKTFSEENFNNFVNTIEIK